MDGARIATLRVVEMADRKIRFQVRAILNHLVRQTYGLNFHGRTPGPRPETIVAICLSAVGFPDAIPLENNDDCASRGRMYRGVSSGALGFSRAICPMSLALDCRL